MPEISEDELAAFKAASEERDSLKVSKSRLEDENSKTKLRAKDAEDKLSIAETAKLEAEGNTKELLDKERGKNLDLQKQFDDRTSSVQRANLKAALGEVAKDAHSIDMLLKVSKHKGLLKPDEENLTYTGVEEFVAECRKTDPYLFSKKSIDAGDITPPGGPADDVFKSENDKYLSELKTCHNRKEMDAVRKKYGK